MFSAVTRNIKHDREIQITDFIIDGVVSHAIKGSALRIIETIKYKSLFAIFLQRNECIFFISVQYNYMITQSVQLVKQLCARSVLGRVTAGPWPAHRKR